MKRLMGHLEGTNIRLAVTATILIGSFLSFILSSPELVNQFVMYWQMLITNYFSSYLIWIVTIVMIFTLLIIISPYGHITLGKDGEKPEFTRFSWFSMLFGAGIGTGILFFGVAEPILHLQQNPFLAMENIEPITNEAAVIAQRITLFHWGLHGWATYSVVGLCLGYFSYRKGLPLTIRSSLYPFIGDRIYGLTGDFIDLLAVFSTLFGIAVTLGLGASQMASGLEYLFNIEVTPLFKLGIILVVSAIATISAVSGVNRGIRKLSELNIWLCIILIGCFLFAGPTLAIISSIFYGSIDYMRTFLPMGTWVDPSNEIGWQTAWTLFYWGWWVSWGPFVGMFMARISRGRNLREYVIGTLLVPTFIGFIWLCVLGATALDLQLNQSGNLIQAVNQDMTQALFRTFELLNLGWATWPVVLLATVLIATWFVTSSDSGTLVICTILCSGKKNPPRALRIFWGFIIALVAGLLLLTGGLVALQTATTAIALPFSIVLILMILGLSKALYQTEKRK